MAVSDLQQLKMTFITLLLGIISVARATTVADVVTGVTMPMVTTVPTTMDPRFVRLHHKSSSTSSITLNWTVPDSAEVEGYFVESWKIESDSKTMSPTLEWNATEYVVTDLLRNTDYEVCVYAILPHNETDDATEHSCLSVFTIPLIRWDSLLALICVLGTVILLILLGIICWRRELKKQKGDRGESSEDDNKIKSESSQPILLAPPVDGRPRSSIEDEDIPYITPPIEELENDDREYALRARQKSK